MAIVVSRATLVDMAPGWWPSGPAYGSVRMYNQLSYDYATLYRVQPNVRTCVDFLARNVAQLGLHVFRRVSDTDRKRLTAHGLAQLMGRPNPSTTRYRLMEALMGDMGIYFAAYWAKVKAADRIALLRLPPTMVAVYGGLVPTRYEVTVGGKRNEYTPDQIVHFRGYNPEDPIQGLSPMETLRRVLAEEHAMGNYREGFWANAARMNGIIERPEAAPEWSDVARTRFKEEFEELYSGAANSGKTAILEEGMTWKPASFNAQESEYLAGRKLTREECARAFHIPLPMVGILDHATFSNIREQHKNLYQDCLGPWLRMIEEEIELQLLPEFGDTTGIYCEFNIAEKLTGSFEEQMTALQAAVGRPWMTPDEARARMNMPSMGGDAELLGTPLNVMVGGEPNPQDSAPVEPAPIEGAPKALGEKRRRRRGEIDPTLPELREKHVEQWQRVLARTFRRQREAVLSAVPKKATMPMVVEELWDQRRWNAELGADYYRMNYATASVWAQYVAEQAGVELDQARMEDWLLENSRISSEEINGYTRDLIAAALTAEVVHEAMANLFDVALSARVPELAGRAVTTASVFGAQEGARQGGLKTKTWQVNSSNPRPEHAAMDGMTIGIGELFPTGQKWPGDPAGGADNNANCQCSCTFGR